MSSIVEEFLNPEQEKIVIESIKEAELYTSGEIMVHLERHTDLEPIERAKEVFSKLGISNTKLKNGVLFYVGIYDHSFVILGDKGIYEKVPYDFWESTKDMIITHFKNKEYTLGLMKGILEAGKKLKLHFPYDKNGDINELPDEISKS